MFRANRSIRDVEPEVNLFLRDPSGAGNPRDLGGGGRNGSRRTAAARQAPGDDRRAAAGPARAVRRVDGSGRAGNRDRRVAVPGAAFFDPLA